MIPEVASCHFYKSLCVQKVIIYLGHQWPLLMIKGALPVFISKVSKTEQFELQKLLNFPFLLNIDIFRFYFTPLFQFPK